MLEQEIEGVSRRIAERFGRPYAEFRVGVRKQATLPGGAVSLGLAGTAPGLVVEVEGTLVVVLPGPPGELRRLWARALETTRFAPFLATHQSARQARAPVLRRQRVGRRAALADAGGEGEGVEATICARELEIEVDMLVALGGGGRADELVSALRRELGTSLFAEDRRPVEEHVLELCREDSLMLATAESCTGGLVGAR